MDTLPSKELDELIGSLETADPSDTPALCRDLMREAAAKIERLRDIGVDNLADNDEYARCRSIDDKQIVREAMETPIRMVHELGNRYDVVCEKLERAENEPPAVPARVRLLKDIYDDGQDHHPPGYIAKKGEIVEVREVRTLSVAHPGVTDSSFVVMAGEYEPVSAQPPGDETAWLIEFTAVPNHLYFTAEGGGAFDLFSNDHRKAVRFARKQDAETVLRVLHSVRRRDEDGDFVRVMLGPDCYSVTEHMWCSGTTKPDEQS